MSTTQSPLLVPRGAMEGRPAIPISRPVWIIGSRKGCHLHLESKHVSNAHAVIINTGRGLFMKDLASREHTYVNHLAIKEVQLKDGDRVQIGPFKFWFKDPTANPGDKPPVAPVSILRVSGEAIPVPLDGRVTLIGRRETADINLTEESVSTTHALIIDLDGDHYLRDLGSRTGTLLNGQKIRQAPLSPGDQIKIGDTEIAFEHVVESTEEPVESSGESAIALQLDESEEPKPEAELPLPEEPATEAELPTASEAGLPEVEPLPAADLDEILGLAPAPSAAPESAATPLDLSDEPSTSAPELPDELEVSATATPVSEPEPPAIEPQAVPAAEAPEAPIVEPAPKGARRGWKLWGSRQPGPTPPLPKGDATRIIPPPPTEASKMEPPPAVTPPPASKPLELSEPLSLEPPVASDVEPPGMSDVEPPVDESNAAELVTELAPVEEPSAAPAEEPPLELEPVAEEDSGDTAYAVELSPSAAAPGDKDAVEAARDEVTSSDLELSAVEEPHTLDLEASPESEAAAVATEEPKGDDVFGGVDLDALALEALNEPAAPAGEVSATLDLEAAAEPQPAEPELVPPPSLELNEPEPLPPIAEPATKLDLPEPEPIAPVEEAAPELELPAPEAPKAPAPAESQGDLPPPLGTPIKLKPSTRRRKRGDDVPPPRRGPMRGKGGKFISAAEAERLAEDEVTEAVEVEPLNLNEVAAPDQSATSDVGAEVLEFTEPTPESALNLTPETSPIDELPLPTEEPIPSDSVFGKTVQDLAGSASTGDLVDDAAKPLSPLEQIAADATHFVDTDVHEAVEVEHPAEPAAEIIEHDELIEPEAPEATLDLSGSAEPIAEAPSEISEAALELPEMADRAEAFADAAPVEPPLELPAVAEEPAPAPEPEPQAELELPAAGDVEPPAVDEIEPPAELSFDETFEPTASTSLAGDAAPAEPSHTVSEGVEPVSLEPQAPPPTMPGMFGIGRDADAFLGGMPLSLPELAPPPPTFGKVGVSFGESSGANPHLAPPPPPLVIGADDEVAEEAAVEAAAPVISPSDVSGTGTPVAEARSNDTTIMPALPVQEVSATGTPGAPKMPVPPRPRRNRLADYEKRFAKVDEDKALEAMLREQRQAPAEPGPGSSGFDGLTMGPAVRNTDVFSDAPSTSIPVAEAVQPDPFLADKQASIDLAARTVDTGRIPPTTTPSGLTAPPIEPPPGGSDPFGMQVAVPERGKRPSPRYATSAPDFNYTGPTRGSRKIPIRVLVIAMVVFMLGAGAAGFLLTPVYTMLNAKVSFANLKDRSVFDQHKFRTEQQSVLTSETVRSLARGALDRQYPKLDPGLLADPLAFDALARDLDWPSGTNVMLLKVKSVDPDGDRKRLDVLLQSLYSENKHLIDVAAQKKTEFDKAQAEVDQLNAQLKELVLKIRAANDSVSEAPGASVITQVEQEAGQLSDQWQQAVKKVRELKSDLERLAPNGVQATPQPGDVQVVDVAGGDPDKDPVVVTSREELKALQNDIAKLKALGSEDATAKAREALDKAINAYQDELAKLQTGKGAEWQDFLAKARKLQGMTLQMTGEVIDRQRQEQEKLLEMRRKLEQELADRREKVFADDPMLKKLNDDLRLATRSYNVASAENLQAEAARWQADVDKTQTAIVEQQNKLAAGLDDGKRIAEVQKLIDDGKAAITGDRKTLDEQMAGTLKDFMATGNELYKKLNDADRKAADSLCSRAGEMVDAHNIYGSLLNSMKPGDSDVLVKKEADAQQLSARIDARIAEIKDKARKDKTALEAQAMTQRIEETRAAVAAAEKAEQEAGKKWLAKQNELADLRKKAADAKAADDKLQENQKAREALQATIASKVRDLDERRKKDISTIVPEPIAPDAITEGPKDDDRWKYALIASMGVCGLFLVLIWLGGYHHHTPAGGEHVPVIESASKQGGAADEETVVV